MPVALPALLAPAGIAQRWGCKVDTVLALIHAGRLRAINIGRGRLKGRYKVTPEDLAAFERSREVQQQLPRGRRQKVVVADVIKFF